MIETDELELLLVEDDPDDAQVVQRLLVEFGSVDERLVEVDQVNRAERLEDAFVLLDDDPDVVLLDMMLPDSEGLDTVESIVQYAPHVPVVVVTGQRDAGLGPAAIRRGAQDYLKKGRITDDVLHRTLRYAVDRHRKQREVVELNRRLSALTRVVRQDVRADMQMVVGRGDELRGRVGPDDETTKSLLDAARHAIELTDRVSELMAVLSSDTELTLEPIELDEVVDESVARVENRHECDLTVDRETGEHVPTTVMAPPSIGSAFEEILSNAVRHNDSDVPVVTVRIETTDDRLTVAVADDGVGIPDVQRELLNDARTRYHDRARIGTGLYLAMTIVEQAGGHVEFAENIPTGTVVTVELEKETASRSARAGR